MKDIVAIITRLKNVHADLNVTQLAATHLSDDDGIWFIKSTNFSGEIQLESSNGECPFLIESDLNEKRQTACTIDDTIEIVEGLIKLGAEKS